MIAAIVISSRARDDRTAAASPAAARPPRSNQRSRASRRRASSSARRAHEVVAEFVDLQCPFCAEFSTSAFNEVIEQHVRPGEVLWSCGVISFLGEDSGKAAEMAAAAALQNKL